MQQTIQLPHRRQRHLQDARSSAIASWTKVADALDVESRPRDGQHVEKPRLGPRCTFVVCTL
eukprot:4536074-Amphidinium_carterae.1